MEESAMACEVLWNDWQLADLSRMDISYQVAAAEPWGWSPGDLLWHDMLPLRHPIPQRQASADSRMGDGYRELIARAKADIVAIDAEWNVKRLAAACTPADVCEFLEALR